MCKGVVVEAHFCDFFVEIFIFVVHIFGGIQNFTMIKKSIFMPVAWREKISNNINKLKEICFSRKFLIFFFVQIFDVFRR